MLAKIPRRARNHLPVIVSDDNPQMLQAEKDEKNTPYWIVFSGLFFGKFRL